MDYISQNRSIFNNSQFLKIMIDLGESVESDNLSHEESTHIPKYPQLHNIPCFDRANPVLDDHLRRKEHGRQKYNAKYNSPKPPRRKP